MHHCSGAGRLSVFISDTGIFLRSALGRELGAVSVLGEGAESSGADVRRDACMAGPAAGGGATAASEFFRITSCNRVGQVSGSTQKPQVCGPAAGFAAASLRAHSTVHRPFRQGSLPE